MVLRTLADFCENLGCATKEYDGAYLLGSKVVVDNVGMKFALVNIYIGIDGDVQCCGDGANVYKFNLADPDSLEQIESFLTTGRTCQSAESITPTMAAIARVKARRGWKPGR